MSSAAAARRITVQRRAERQWFPLLNSPCLAIHRGDLMPGPPVPGQCDMLPENAAIGEQLHLVA